MCTVFTNDSFYLSARDDLLAVNFYIYYRKLLIISKEMLKLYLLDKLDKDLMAISKLL